ncbi:hypothetical protein [Puniceicoccus vermicola]|uniref:Uncharacterized protein n=1 Tax=Puniceicoccus vermicola TaxID=388746 RepID=A0A7X1AZM4_9BACT|nr:hypothetical protein [Puniceicoccus vermicola]MBC2602837.1 hypothetical protein [Puniceicoccus vermicola]
MKLHTKETVKEAGDQEVVTTTSQFDDEAKELCATGVDSAFHLYNEIGADFARHVSTVLSQQRPDLHEEFRARPKKG